MAVGDMISGADLSVGKNSSTSIRPAAGDEWCLTTLCIAENMSRSEGQGTQIKIDGEYFTGTLTNGDFNSSSDRGNATTKPNFGQVHLYGTWMRLPLTNSEYMEIYGDESGRDISWFGFKTKE